MDFIDKTSNFVKKYMSIMVLIAAITAFLKPSTFTWVAPHVSTLLGFIMLGMGMTLKEDDFMLIVKNPKNVVFGTIIQFTVMPLGAYLCARLFNLPAELAVGLILLGSCPGGVTSNVMSFIAKGDVALSVSITTVSTIISPIVTPAFILLLGGKWVNIDALSMFLSIVKIVLVPIILGGMCRKFFTKFSDESVRILPAMSGMTMVLLVGAIVSVNADKLLSSGLIVIVAGIIHNILGYVLGYFIAEKIGFDEEKKRVISIETGMQNAALATTLAMAHFTPIVAIVPTIVGIWHAFSVSTLANYWANKPIDKESKQLTIGTID